MCVAPLNDVHESEDRLFIAASIISGVLTAASTLIVVVQVMGVLGFAGIVLDHTALILLLVTVIIVVDMCSHVTSAFLEYEAEHMQQMFAVLEVWFTCKCSRLCVCCKSSVFFSFNLMCFQFFDPKRLICLDPYYATEQRTHIKNYAWF